MRITDIATYLISRGATPTPTGESFLFVKIETDDGIVGWGEAYAIRPRERAIEANIEALGRVLVSLEQVSPRAFRRHVAAKLAHAHPGTDFSAAVSALEIALWDAWGKTLNAPLHRLLGGALVDRVPLYANAWRDEGTTIDALAEHCRELAGQGFQAVKIYPMRYPTLTQSADCVRAVRDAVGPAVDILIDIAVLDDPQDALAAARAFEPFAPYWFEEPLSSEDVDALAALRRKTDLRIVTGERVYGKTRFREILQKQAADVLNPDIAGTGGILETLEIAAMAEAHSVMVSPHCWSSTTVAFAALVHVCALMPNALAGELYPGYLTLGSEIAACDFEIVDGHATLPQAPGLGVSMNEAILTERAAM